MDQGRRSGFPLNARGFPACAPPLPDVRPSPSPDRCVPCRCEPGPRPRRRRGTFAVAFLAVGAYCGVSRFQPTVVSGKSMEPTLHNRELVWLDRTAYAPGTPRRGEVIVFLQAGKTCVKRVYRGPGETIHYLREADGWYALVRDLRHPRIRQWCRVAGATPRTARVDPDEVWVVGDNAHASEDSRVYGPIPLASVLGRVRLRPDVAQLGACEFRPAPQRPGTRGSDRPRIDRRRPRALTEKPATLAARTGPRAGDRAAPRAPE